MGKTGGGVGTNQYQVKGRSKTPISRPRVAPALAASLVTTNLVALTRLGEATEDQTPSRANPGWTTEADGRLSALGTAARTAAAHDLTSIASAARRAAHDVLVMDATDETDLDRHQVGFLVGCRGCGAGRWASYRATDGHLARSGAEPPLGDPMRPCSGQLWGEGLATRGLAGISRP
ncbi:MAG: hypothetical protein ACRD0J_15075 [Acidimicrobiales bacterium]